MEPVYQGGKRWWAPLLWSLVFGVGGVVTTVALFIPLSYLPDQAQGPWQGALQQSFAMLLAFGLMTWLVGVKGARLTFEQLRWTAPGVGWVGFRRGLVLGMLAAAGTMLLVVVTTTAEWYWKGGRVVDWVVAMLRVGVVLVPAALAEEIIFRGVPLVLLGALMGRWSAVLMLSGLFASAHLGNPNLVPLAVGNIALAGVFLSGCFFLRGGIWTAFGAHLAWNLTLAGLAAPVSGLTTEMPILGYDPGTLDWFSGGAFGPEGGVSATLGLGIATGIVVNIISKERS